VQGARGKDKGSRFTVDSSQLTVHGKRGKVTRGHARVLRLTRVFGDDKIFCNYFKSKKTKHSSLDLWYIKSANAEFYDVIIPVSKHDKMRTDVRR